MAEGVKIYRGHRDLPSPLRAPAVTLGNFDGVHLGHQRLFSETIALARAAGGESAVYTFRPHPGKVLAPDLAPPLITPYDEKLRLFERCGIDVVIEETFDPVFAAIEPDDFVRRVLAGAVGARHVVVGHDFTFGRHRAGNVDLLRRIGQELGFEVHLVPAVEVGGIIASSTKVREFVLEGRVRGAALLLGRDFAVSGRVVRGAGRGRSIGFPTANVLTDQELLPKPGVYAGYAFMTTEKVPAVVNIGYAPTFQGRDLTLEAHLLDWQGDLYDTEMTVAFHVRLRDERRFPSVEELSAQIGRDVAEARTVL